MKMKMNVLKKKKKNCSNKISDNESLGELTTIVIEKDIES